MQELVFLGLRSGQHAGEGAELWELERAEFGREGLHVGTVGAWTAHMKGRHVKAGGALKHVWEDDAAVVVLQFADVLRDGVAEATALIGHENSTRSLPVAKF